MIKGTAQVHKNIYLDQLQITEQEVPEVNSVNEAQVKEQAARVEERLDTSPHFTERLHFVYGDQLTTSNVRTLKRDRVASRRAFDC